MRNFFFMAVIALVLGGISHIAHADSRDDAKAEADMVAERIRAAMADEAVEIEQSCNGDDCVITLSRKD